MRSTLFVLPLAGAVVFAGCMSGGKQGSAGASAAALGATDTTSHVRALLGSYEQGPSKEAWLKMGGDVPASLQQIAQDANELPSRRARACEVLGWFGSTGLTTLRSTLANADLPGGIRMGAVTGLARALPTAEAVPAMTQALADKDAMVRFRSVLELQRLGGPEAQAALQARSGIETDGSVRKALGDALEKQAPAVTPSTPAIRTP
jgi:HEAT repeat protein